MTTVLEELKARLLKATMLGRQDKRLLQSEQMN